jgi:hypothetical protein
MIYLISFLAFFIGVFLVSFPTPDVDARTLLPVLICLLLVLFALTDYALKRGGALSILGVVLGIAMVVTVMGYGVLSLDIITGLHRTGLGYTSLAWRTSETLAAVSDLPEDEEWISNEPMPVLLYHNRWPHEIEELADQEPVEVFLGFGDGSTASDVLFRENSAYLILFDSIQGQLEPLYSERTESRLEAFVQDLVIEFSGEDGRIYSYPK